MSFDDEIEKRLIKYIHEQIELGIQRYIAVDGSEREQHLTTVVNTQTKEIKRLRTIIEAWAEGLTQIKSHDAVGIEDEKAAELLKMEWKEEDPWQIKTEK